MKTLLVTIGIVVAGIAYAGDLDPPMGPIAVIGEGKNGFVITDIEQHLGSTGFTRIFVDEGNGPVEVFRFAAGNSSIHYSTGIPVSAGSTITATLSSSSQFSILGYVY